MSIENEEIQKAIQAAELRHESLLVKLKDYEKTKQELARLELFITSGKNLLGVDTIKGTAETLTHALSLPSGKAQTGTHKDRIIRILSDAGRALSLTEIATEYSKRNWTLSENNGREVLRGVIIRKKDAFKREIKGNKTFISLAGQQIDS